MMFTTVLLYTLAGFAAAQTGDLDVPVGTMSPTRPVPPTSKTVILTTKTVTELTTYCPKPTEITMGSSTYTVTVATTLTITDCPCTVVEPCHTCKPGQSQPAKSSRSSEKPPTETGKPPCSTCVPSVPAGAGVVKFGGMAALIAGLLAL